MIDFFIAEKMWTVLA